MGKTLLGGGKSTSKPVDLQAPEFKALRDDFASSILNFLGGSIGPGGAPGLPTPTQIGAPPGETAPITGAETDLLNQLLSEGTTRRDLIEKTQSGHFLPGQPGSNPFLDEAIRAAQRPTEEALNRTLSRTLPGTFTAAGHQIGGGLRSPNANLNPGSTAFDLAASHAFGEGSRALGDIATNISAGNFENERQRQLASIGLGQEEVNSTINKLSASSLPRMIQEVGIERGLTQFKESVEQYLEALRIAFGTTAPVSATQTKTETSGGLVGLLKALPIAPR